MKVPTALITGFGGQDGPYLCEILLENGYTVHGLLRQRSSTQRWSEETTSNPIFPPQLIGSRLFIHFGDILDPYYILNLLKSHHFDEIYHLAAQSHVGVSFDLQMYTSDVNALGTLRILQAISTLGLNSRVKFYNACSSEVFGQVKTVKQNESSTFSPVSPYAAAKAFSFWITATARVSHGLFAVNGILFNHESPRRGFNFVTRKISSSVALIHLGRKDRLRLGNLDSRRDWGHARDYMRGIYNMMHHPTPDDYVLATGETRSVRDFAVAAFKVVGVNLRWEGIGAQEVGIDENTRQVRIEIDGRLFRPAEVPYLRGDAAKARKELNWMPSTSFENLVKEMVLADIAMAKADRLSEARVMGNSKL